MARSPVRDTGGLGGGLHIGDVGLHLRFAAILRRPGADDGNNRQDRTAHHRFLEILRVIFREGCHLLLEDEKLLIGAQSFEALADVGEEAGLKGNMDG
jgi:hypothetical protein